MLRIHMMTPVTYGRGGSIVIIQLKCTNVRLWKNTFSSIFAYKKLNNKSICNRLKGKHKSEKYSFVLLPHITAGVCTTVYIV